MRSYVLFILIFRHLSIAVSDVDDTSDDSSHGSFWQLTDIHYDANYSSNTGGEQHHEQGPGISVASCKGYFGNYSCDSPWELVVSAIDAMKAIHPKPDFVLWTGDSVPHAENKYLDEQKVLNLIRNVTNELTKVFANVSIYPMIGNHDVWPSDQIPVNIDDTYYNKILSETGWDKILVMNEKADFKRGGYYASDISPHVRLLCINSNLWYSQDHLAANSTDPADQFHWLETQMENARETKKQVLLAGHVPPGMFERVTNISWMYPIFNQRFHWFLQRNSEIITSSIFGHEHTDSFRIVYDTEGRPRMPIFLAPAVTPWKSSLPGAGSNNPALRLYKYNRKTGRIIDYTQYYLNLLNTVKKADWRPEYKAAKEYHLGNLSAESLQSLIDQFKVDSAVFQNYYVYNSVSFDRSVCSEECKKQHLCAITKIDFGEYAKCNNDDEERHHTRPTDHPNREHKRKEVEMLTYYFLGGLLVFIIILFMIIAFCCCQRQRAVLRLGRSRYVIIQQEA